HYFEITTLPDTIPGIANVHLNATEHNDNIVFLHKVQEGPASKSYGLQVAKLAGIPAAVLRQAQEQLQLLEQGQHPVQPATGKHVDQTGAAPPVEMPLQGVLFEAMPYPAIEVLNEINTNNLMGRDALEQLDRIVEILTKGK